MSAVTLESGVYFIQNAGTGTVIDLGSNVDGTKVQGYTKRELNDSWVSAQLWIISKVGNDAVYTIQSAGSRTFLDLDNGLTANGTSIIGFQGTGNPNQRWIVTRNTINTAYIIVNQAAGTAVDLSGGSPANGATIQGWAAEGPGTSNLNQLWHIVRA